MKAMARPNAQLGVPCRCLVTGLQVNIIPNLLILNSDHFLHYYDFFFLIFLNTGHVGPPLPCNDIKLVDVAEMNYFAANGEGEVGSARVQLTWNKMLVSHF